MQEESQISGFLFCLGIKKPRVSPGLSQLVFSLSSASQVAGNVSCECSASVIFFSILATYQGGTASVGLNVDSMKGPTAGVMDVALGESKI